MSNKDEARQQRLAKRRVRRGNAKDRRKLRSYLRYRGLTNISDDPTLVRKDNENET